MSGQFYVSLLDKWSNWFVVLIRYLAFVCSLFILPEWNITITCMRYISDRRNFNLSSIDGYNQNILIKSWIPKELLKYANENSIRIVF